MKKMLKLAHDMSLAIVLCLTGCTSARCYLTDRGRDVMDVVTATVGTGAGVQARLGPYPFGWMRATDITGMRYGDVFYRLPEEEDEPEEFNGKLGAVFCYTFSPLLGLVGANFFEVYDDLGYMWRYHNHFPMNEVQLSRNKSTENLALPNYTQLEISAGLGFSLRLGLNPGEFLDLVLGLATIDIFNDDIEWKEGKSNQKLDPIVKTPVETDEEQCTAGQH